MQLPPLKWCLFDLRVAGEPMPKLIYTAAIVSAIVVSTPCYSEAQSNEIENSCASTLKQNYPTGLDRKYFRYPPDNLEDPLPSWNYAEIINAAIKSSSEWHEDEIKEVQLLAWHGSVDGRPLYINSAFVAIVLESDKGVRRWVLAHLAQNPIPGCGGQVNWSPYVIFDNPWKPVRIFSYRPTQEEVENFLYQWKRSLSEPRYKILTVGIRAKSWERILGSAPLELAKLIKR